MPPRQMPPYSVTPSNAHTPATVPADLRTARKSAEAATWPSALRDHDSGRARMGSKSLHVDALARVEQPSALRAAPSTTFAVDHFCAAAAGMHRVGAALRRAHHATASASPPRPCAATPRLHGRDPASSRSNGVRLRRSGSCATPTCPRPLHSSRSAGATAAARLQAAPPDHCRGRRGRPSGASCALARAPRISSTSLAASAPPAASQRSPRHTPNALRPSCAASALDALGAEVNASIARLEARLRDCRL